MAKKKFTQSGTQTYSGSTPLAEKLINYIMKDGKKNVARKIYYEMLKEVKKQGHMNPQIVVDNAVANASPAVMIKSKRVG
jgi:small subunit ribosomal protein S7